MAARGQAVAPFIPNGGTELLFPPERRGMLMITYQELFQFCMLIVGIITLVYQLTKKK